MNAPARRTSATVIGAVSGVLAAVTVLPTVLPLSHRIQQVEEAALLERVEIAAAGLSSLPVDAAQRGLAPVLGVDALFILNGGSLSWSDGRAPLPADLHAACAPRPHSRGYLHESGQKWAVGCRSRGDVVYAATVRPDVAQGGFVGWLVVGLALIVGLTTTLGVLQLLSPIYGLSATLARMGAGERGVRARRTGVAELDELGATLNATARAIESREDAIRSRIAVVQELARMVAHEVRNPLQSLELLATLIATEDDAEERNAYANSIHHEVRTLDAVVSRLLRDGEEGGLRLHRTRTELAGLLEDIITFREPDARRREVAITLECAAEAVVYADRPLVGRAIENLIDNAVRHATSDRPGHVHIIVQVEDGRVRLDVEDNGPGVADSVSASVWEPGVSGRPNGTGLGLALVRAVILAHDGYVDHGDSTMGGARFSISLPLQTAKDEPE